VRRAALRQLQDRDNLLIVDPVLRNGRPRAAITINLASLNSETNLSRTLEPGDDFHIDVKQPLKRSHIHPASHAGSGCAEVPALFGAELVKRLHAFFSPQIANAQIGRHAAYPREIEKVHIADLLRLKHRLRDKAVIEGDDGRAVLGRRAVQPAHSR
jgi:hypothetical protein